MDSNSGYFGIRFNDCLFSEPVCLAAWTQPRFAGLIVILVNDPNWAPRPFQPLYFGEFGNNAPLPPLLRDYARLTALAKGRTSYVSVLPMPFSTAAQRWQMHNQLVSAYNPEGQTDGATLPHGELATRLSDLEKQHHDQAAQVMSLLATLNPSFQPRPEAPRRRIGFLPQAEPAAG